jgi:hypothetical protein
MCLNFRFPPMISGCSCHVPGAASSGPSCTNKPSPDTRSSLGRGGGYGQEARKGPRWKNEVLSQELHSVSTQGPPSTGPREERESTLPCPGASCPPVGFQPWPLDLPWPQLSSCLLGMEPLCPVPRTGSILLYGHAGTAPQPCTPPWHCADTRDMAHFRDGETKSHKGHCVLKDPGWAAQ